MTRHEQDTRAGILGAAASLAQIASTITVATSEPDTRNVAALVHSSAGQWKPSGG